MKNIATGGNLALVLSILGLLGIIYIKFDLITFISTSIHQDYLPSSWDHEISLEYRISIFLLSLGALLLSLIQINNNKDQLKGLIAIIIALLNFVLLLI